MSDQPIILHIVTPCTRPENLMAIYESMPSNAGLYRNNISVYWYVYVDESAKDKINGSIENELARTNITLIHSKQSGIAGHVHRNSHLMYCEWHERTIRAAPGINWIMSLDDDNILHPYLIPWLAENKIKVNRCSGLIFDQVHKNGDRRLTANPDLIKVGFVDTAQYMFRSDIVSGLRFDQTRYDADGVFIEELYRRNKDKFLIVNQPLCYYNYLRS